MTLEDTNPAPAAAPGGLHPTLDRINADINAAKGDGAAPTEANGAPPIASPQSLEIDFGGTKRVVSVNDLQEAYAKITTIYSMKSFIHYLVQKIF